MKQFAHKGLVYAAQWNNNKHDDKVFARYNDAASNYCISCGKKLNHHAVAHDSSIVCPTEWYVVEDDGARCYTLNDEEFEKQFCYVGEMSDGYHTFNALYHHRAVLFAALCKCYPERVWKSCKHHDGSMYEGMFIVGITTDEGDATYHYDIDPYWGTFDCKLLKQAPVWDGHTPDEALRRITTLKKGN